jgi:Zn-dependent protease with chaperone function
MEGTYFDGKTSKRQACTLRVDDGQSITLPGIMDTAVPLAALSISPRIGDSTRFITFPDGGVFETRDNAAVDALSTNTTSQQLQQEIHGWERSIKMIVLSVVLLVAVTYLLLAFGIPAFSERLAHALPASVSTKLAGEVLTRLDEQVLGPSELSEERQRELTAQFDRHAQGLGEHSLTLKFRKGKLVKANAFALPDGTIVITDELVALAGNDLELQSVMLHEIGHVVHRHSLRGLIESSSSMLVLIWLTGDVEAGSSWFSILPTILLNSSYSRDKEWEADGYALERMHEANISTRHFANLLNKLVATESAARKAREAKGDTAAKNGDQQNDQDADKKPGQADDKQEDSTWLDYISSHPATQSRIQRFQGSAPER